MAAWSDWVPLVDAMQSAPRLPGVYLARVGLAGPIVYVGMAGERRGAGIRGRLSVYLSGKALASGLGEAVFDRALADPEWLRQRLDEVDSGAPRRAKDWGREAMAWSDLHICWAVSPDRSAALALESSAITALAESGLWNRRL